MKTRTFKPGALGWSTVLLFVWLLLLVPWVIFAPLSAMAFEDGATVKAYVFFWSILTYPVSVAIAAVFRRKAPPLVLLPILNLAAWFGSGM